MHFLCSFILEQAAHLDEGGIENGARLARPCSIIVVATTKAFLIDHL
jgi:predicted Ser/Thr protein kinase